jgi:hypothetical protein
MDFDEKARQAAEVVAAGEQVDTAAVQACARTLNFSPEPAEYPVALGVRIRKLEGLRGNQHVRSTPCGPHRAGER